MFYIIQCSSTKVNSILRWNRWGLYSILDQLSLTRSSVFCRCKMENWNIIVSLITVLKCRWLLHLKFTTAAECAMLLFIRTHHTSQRRCTCYRRCSQVHAALRYDTVWLLQREMWLVLPSWCCIGRRWARVCPPMPQCYRWAAAWTVSAYFW